ncbi:hypothetical protein PUNSTDRAFT_137455 [Punctularia strigosozonata HHB-11173 SS5]|uniref:uncharacterized protein n=1 Tax=Punctularia strigosozonata (strain HHB-11173) TaxID=741275 RepID=UPI00044179BF|nr:uncharacterized protein PUNSTDRAFT_137455 [Punctularia strigosozonata HHB-11173 SS5]EIN05341.1 hypothetical protein PUNSTDRAFT_137455 [Punctularia strigosozonata HHB-11173 SS5]
MPPKPLKLPSIPPNPPPSASGRVDTNHSTTGRAKASLIAASNASVRANAKPDASALVNPSTSSKATPVSLSLPTKSAPTPPAKPLAAPVDSRGSGSSSSGSSPSDACNHDQTSVGGVAGKHAVYFHSSWSSHACRSSRSLGRHRSRSIHCEQTASIDLARTHTRERECERSYALAAGHPNKIQIVHRYSHSVCASRSRDAGHSEIGVDAFFPASRPASGPAQIDTAAPGIQNGEDQLDDDDDDASLHCSTLAAYPWGEQAAIVGRVVKYGLNAYDYCNTESYLVLGRGIGRKEGG